MTISEKQIMQLIYIARSYVTMLAESKDIINHFSASRINALLYDISA